MHRQVTGQFDLIQAVKSGDPYAAVFKILDTLPLSTVLAVIYIVVVIGFICTTLDTASLCLASTTIKKLDENNDPSKKSRLFWCIMLTLLPLALMYSGADFTAMKYIAIIVSVPIAIVMLFMLIGLFRWMRQDRRTPGMLHYQQNDYVDYDKPSAELAEDVASVNAETVAMNQETIKEE